MSYAATYSKADNSILGWSVNIEENGQQQPDVKTLRKLQLQNLQVPFENNKPTTNNPQIYYISGRLKHLGHFSCQRKLFIFDEFGFVQWDLIKMSVDMEYRYSFDYDDECLPDSFNLVISKNQTFLALNINTKIDIFLIETGLWISSYG
ncbi:hypothetical protein C1645_880809 [Glomus cerebriforme]|uniref:Uncharacterized protein n=1 Tax=Glomus cerebriforme TaxID=658196 RepID=A0A397SA86_9GLOM|nr:hypothetical protein C1645_880809 [Glomus cerebriforme]